jgi:hypothetical protein
MPEAAIHFGTSVDTLRDSPFPSLASGLPTVLLSICVIQQLTEYVFQAEVDQTISKLRCQL